MSISSYFQKEDTMKKLLTAITLFIIVFLISPAYAQNQGNQKKQSESSLPGGFGEVQWGMSIDDVKSKVIGKITYIDEKRVIMSKENNIEYTYGFFHTDPSIAGPAAAQQDKNAAGKDANKKSPQPAATQHPKLYFVLVKFPYLAMEDVKKKITDKYGPHTGENINDNQGALIWDSKKTAIMMWVDRYEKLPFCRKITYLGKELAKDVNEYQKKIFSKTEIEILRNLNP